jgi:hypothetical protein
MSRLARRHALGTTLESGLETQKNAALYSAIRQVKLHGVRGCNIREGDILVLSRRTPEHDVSRQLSKMYTVSTAHFLLQSRTTHEDIL